MEALPMPTKPLFALLAAALLGLASASPCEAAIVKWTDEKGVVHYGDKIPPEYAGKANAELDNSGVTRKKNEGQLTPEQIKQRAADQKAKDEEKEKALQIKRRNTALLTTYNSVQEIDTAREKNLRQAEEIIRGIQQKISDTQAHQVQLQKEASSYGNKKLPAELQNSINDADKELRDNQQLVVSQRKELDSIRAKFDEDKRVYIELTGNPEPVIAPAPGPAKK
jgi:paraquat-inducible protein B